MTDTTGDAPTVTRLVLIRHGESQVTVERVIGGPRTCSGLSELGRRQAERLRDRLAETRELDADVLISSQYPRAQETADAIAPGLGGLPIAIDAGFGEHDPGPEIDGMSFEQYVERYGRPEWQGDPHATVFPGGETIAEFHLRVGAALSSTMAAHEGRTVVISCHGGVVDAVFRQLLRTPTTGSFELHTLNTSLTTFERWSGQPWRLTRYNDVAHLAGLPDATEPT